MKTIAMLNAKGGVGKTTSALCFADILARDYDKRVLVIDLDAQRNTGSQLGAGGCEIGVDTLLLDKDADIRELIRHTPFERIDVLPCTTRLEEANLKVLLDTSSVQQFRLKRHLRRVSGDYDYCILDCPTAIKNISTINGLAFTDDVLVPLTADDYSLQGLTDIVAVINDVKEYNDEIDLRGCFITQWENNNCHKAVATQLADALGNRRLTAMKKLLEEGDTRWQMVPCVVSNPPELDLPISDELKELYALTTTNAEQRSKTDHDKMLDIQAMRRIYTALKDAGYPLAEYQRSFVAANLNMSESQVQRLEYLDGHLNDGFKQLMAAEKLPSTVATMISKLPEEDQAALLQRQREDPAAFNTGTVMTYLREKSKAAEEQAATDDTGAELTVGKDFIAEIRQQVRDIDFLLSKGDRRIQKGRSAKLLRLQKQVREKLEDMFEVIDLGVKK